jgi:hypothetical protein
MGALRAVLLLTRVMLAVMGNDLLATLQEQAQYIDYYKSMPPVACPRDGTPLLNGPPGEPGILYCPFDFWKYPEDYDAETMSGM